MKKNDKNVLFVILHAESSAHLYYDLFACNVQVERCWLGWGEGLDRRGITCRAAISLSGTAAVRLAPRSSFGSGFLPVNKVRKRKNSSDILGATSLG